ARQSALRLAARLAHPYTLVHARTSLLSSSPDAPHAADGGEESGGDLCGAAAACLLSHGALDTLDAAVGGHRFLGWAGVADVCGGGGQTYRGRSSCHLRS